MTTGTNLALTKADLVLPRAAVEAPPRTTFITGKLYDSICFIFAPIVALLLVEVVSRMSWSLEPRLLLGVKDRPLAFLLAIWTYAHLFAVVFRSHANPEIFVQHRFRFVGVPLLVFGALMISDWAMISGIVLIVFWDVYHTSMQTFGLGRIYDARRGNSAQAGRTLDLWLNHVIYIGPILAGPSLLPTLSTLQNFAVVGWKAPGHWLEQVQAGREVLRLVVVVLGVAFVGFYVYAYRRLIRSGYRLSTQKVALLVSTATVSILAWGFLEPWKAFFVANLFHGLQYFAIVWSIEKKSIARTFGLTDVRLGTALSLVAFATTVLLVGTGYRLYGDYRIIRWTGALGIVISLMHFWYDGFVWSVRKREV